jgi:hypothetical protein
MSDSGSASLLLLTRTSCHTPNLSDHFMVNYPVVCSLLIPFSASALDCPFSRRPVPRRTSEVPSCERDALTWLTATCLEADATSPVPDPKVGNLETHLTGGFSENGLSRHGGL